MKYHSSAQKPLLALFFAIFVGLCSRPATAQQLLLPQTAASEATSPLITQPVEESRLTVLKGNTHPLARPQFDLGTASPTLPMQRMLLVLKRSPGDS
jgi:hypothetical protein